MSQQIGVLTIPSGQTDSNTMTQDDFGRCDSIVILCDESALTGTCTLESGNARVPTSYQTVQSPPGTDVTIAADKATVLTALPFPSIRIHSSGAEAEDRTFPIWGQVRS